MKKADQYEIEILKVIAENTLFDIKSIFAFYKGCCRATFYNNELDKLDSIKNAIEDNKIITCHSLKTEWLKSKNPILQLALFKTICSDEERKALSMQQFEHSGIPAPVSINVTSKENADKLNDFLNGKPI